MNIDVIKNTIKDLVNQSNSIGEKNDNVIQSSQFTQPFFESLGWDFNTDVKSENFENLTINAFQIDNVTRFYLKEFPLNSSLELLNDEIKSCVSYGFNKGVTWVIVTNFKEIKVYNTESTGRTLASMQHYTFLASEYVEKFQKLSDLTKKQFSLNVLDDSAEYFGKKPKRISIDKQLLEDFLHYRNILVNDISNKNSISENDVQFVAQKILNRLIFIRSCGDRQIENRHLKSAIHEWEKNKNKKLIYYLQEIFSYFRGRYGSTLFEKHHCDELIISDNVLQQVIEGTYQSKKKAVRYNFAHIEHDSLGKMYENYLGTVQQKKDGAYYTPSYISKNICENTIIPYLSKSNATEILDLISEYSDNIEELEAKIHDIKILDPACGTGEFLIRAIDVLLEISTEIQAQKEASGQYTHTVKGKKSGSVSYQTFGKDVENKEIRRIIQNNIHGVDINEEAIEITKLNMFLKLATSSQQLIDLSKNIREGNSLIDDPNVDPNAFDWNKEFPEKFDIVIGNPPYLRVQGLHENNEKSIEFFEKKFRSATGRYDLYILFLEKGIQLLKENGLLSFILPNKFLGSEYGREIRKIIYEKNLLYAFLNFKHNFVWKKVSTYTGIVFLKKSLNKTFQYHEIEDIKNTSLEAVVKSLTKKNYFKLNSNILSSKKWNLKSGKNLIILEKIENSGPDLLYYFQNILQGIVTGNNDIYCITKIKEKKNNVVVFSKKLNSEIEFEKENIFSVLGGRDIKRYKHVLKNKNNLIYPYYFKKGIQEARTIDTLEKEYPLLFKYLNNFKKDLIHLKNKYKMNPINWHHLHRPRKLSWFNQEKIITPQISLGCNMTLDKTGFLHMDQVYSFIKKSTTDIPNEYFLGILNSKLLWFFIKSTSPVLRGGYYSFKSKYLELFHIPKYVNNESQNKIIKNVKQIIEFESIHHNQYEIPEKQFLQIEKLENEINEIVYSLYDLDDTEKKIVESNYPLQTKKKQ
jgi:hypothetical protein